MARQSSNRQGPWRRIGSVARRQSSSAFSHSSRPIRTGSRPSPAEDSSRPERTVPRGTSGQPGGRVRSRCPWQRPGLLERIVGPSCLRNCGVARRCRLPHQPPTTTGCAPTRPVPRANALRARRAPHAARFPFPVERWRCPPVKSPVPTFADRRSSRRSRLASRRDQARTATNVAPAEPDPIEQLLCDSH